MKFEKLISLIIVVAVVAMIPVVLKIGEIGEKQLLNNQTFSGKIIEHNWKRMIKIKENTKKKNIKSYRILTTYGVGNSPEWPNLDATQNFEILEKSTVYNIKVAIFYQGSHKIITIPLSFSEWLNYQNQGILQLAYNEEQNIMMRPRNGFRYRPEIKEKEDSGFSFYWIFRL